MTVDSLREHEGIALHYFPEDYRRKSLEQLVEQYVVGQRVLDMRCLTGHLAVGLATRGFEVTALDAFEEGAKMTNALARDRGLPRELAQVWDLANFPSDVRGRRFDTVICLDTLNHVKDDQQTVVDIVDLLAVGGRLILLAPAFPGLHGKRDGALGHLRRYAKGTLRDLLECNGLEIDQFRYWNFTALPAYFVFERGLRKEVPKKLRFAGDGLFGGLPNRVLRWWYRTVENRIWFPVGLSHFVIAHKRR